MEPAIIFDFVFKGLLAISQLALFIYVRNSTRNDKVDERFGKVHGDIEKHAGRLSHLEAHAEDAPTHDDLAKMHEKINRVAESQSRLEGAVAGVDDNVQRILNRIVQKGLS